MDNKIRAIHECIEGENWKQALKLVKNAQKKKPKQVVLRNLKARALAGSGDWNAAYAEFRTLVEEDNRENAHLLDGTALTLGLADEIASLRGARYEANPGDVETALSAFEGYVMCSDYEKQQKVAASLMKRNPKELRWYMYVVTSNLLRARKSGEDSLMGLCELMLQRKLDAYGSLEGADNSTRKEASQVLRLLLDVYESVGKHSASLELLEGEFGDLYTPPESRLQRRARLCSSLERWKDAYDVYRTLLEEHNPDGWDYIVGLMDACAAMSDDGDGEVSSFIDSLQRSNPHSRGPRLAKLEMCLRKAMVSAGDGDDGLGEDGRASLHALVVDYFDSFGSKPACFSDLCRYVQRVGPHRGLEEDLMARVPPPPPPTAKRRGGEGDEQNGVADEGGEEEAPFPAVASRLIALGNAHKLCRCMGSHVGASVEKITQVAQECWAGYLESLPLMHRMEDTEYGVGDDLAMLCSISLVQRYRMAQEAGDGEDARAHLCTAAVVLEAALDARRHNHNAMLMLIAVYSMLGAGDSLCALVDRLHIRHIQSDTLSFLVLDDAVQLGLYERAERVCAKVRGFHKEHEETYHRGLGRAYGAGNFHKIEELVNFWQRLRQSRQLAEANVELALLRIARATTDQDGPGCTDALERLAAPLTKEYTRVRPQHSFAPCPNALLFPTTGEEVARLVENAHSSDLLETWTPPNELQHSVLHRPSDRVGRTSAAWRCVTNEARAKALQSRSLRAQLIVLAAREALSCSPSGGGGGAREDAPDSGRASKNAKGGGRQRRARGGGKRRQRGGRRGPRGGGPPLSAPAAAESPPSVVGSVRFGDVLCAYEALVVPAASSGAAGESLVEMDEIADVADGSLLSLFTAAKHAMPGQQEPGDDDESAVVVVSSLETFRSRLNSIVESVDAWSTSCRALSARELSAFSCVVDDILVPSISVLRCVSKVVRSSKGGSAKPSVKRALKETRAALDANSKRLKEMFMKRASSATPTLSDQLSCGLDHTPRTYAAVKRIQTGMDQSIKKSLHGFSSRCVSV